MARPRPLSRQTFGAGIRTLLGVCRCVEPMGSLDDEAALGAPGNVVLVQVWEHYLKEVFQVLLAGWALGVVQQCGVVSYGAQMGVDLLPLVEGFDDANELVWVEVPNVGPRRCGEEQSFLGLAFRHGLGGGHYGLMEGLVGRGSVCGWEACGGVHLRSPRNVVDQTLPVGGWILSASLLPHAWSWVVWPNFIQLLVSVPPMKNDVMVGCDDSSWRRSQVPIGGRKPLSASRARSSHSRQSQVDKHRLEG